ncbi:MAG: hypothetical protein FWB90_06590 [Fibromonadales bacterium]|nr:hypothetical protein [Fibromonadales bacterium]
MRIFTKILPTALLIAFLAQASFAANGNIYDRDLVRGFLGLKGDFRSMKSDGVKLINSATGKSYSKIYVDGHVEIGAEHLQLRTWFDIDFMPITPERGDTEWFSYGITWMWGYKLLHQNSIFNIIPSIGPGVELMNTRASNNTELASSFGPTLNLELELRLQGGQFSAGIYGGYKVVRHYGWDDLSADNASGWPSRGDVNADRAFVGLKLSWTMLNNFQRREKDLF